MGDVAAMQGLQATAARTLLDIVRDGAYRSAELFWSELAGTSAATLTATNSSGSTSHLRTPSAIFDTLEDLRAAMAEPAKGTWLSVIVRVTAEGQYIFDFNYDRRPYWTSPTYFDPTSRDVTDPNPSDEAFVDDLVDYPRASEFIPSWHPTPIGAAIVSPSSQPVPESAGFASSDGDALFPPPLAALASNPDWVELAEALRRELIGVGVEGDLLTADQEVQAAYSRVFDLFISSGTAVMIKKIWEPINAVVGYPPRSTDIPDDEPVAKPSEALEILLEDISDALATIAEHQLTLDPMASSPRSTMTESSASPATTAQNSSGSELADAADRGDAPAVDRLLREGADQVPRASGLTPQRLAMRHGHIEVLRLLQQAIGDEQQLDRPVDAGPSAVVLRWYYPKAYWLILAVLPAVAGVIIGVARSTASAVAAGLILSAVGAALAFVVVGLNGLERFAFDGGRFWYRSFRSYQGPVDLSQLRAVYLVPASSGAKLFLLQDDAGVSIKARISHGFDADTVAALNATRSLRSLAVMANTSSMYPGYVAEIARHALASSAVIDGRARALFERALADEQAMRTTVTGLRALS